MDIWFWLITDGSPNIVTKIFTSPIALCGPNMLSWSSYSLNAARHIRHYFRWNIIVNMPLNHTRVIVQSCDQLQEISVYSLVHEYLIQRGNYVNTWDAKMTAILHTILPNNFLSLRKFWFESYLNQLYRMNMIEDFPIQLQETVEKYFNLFTVEIIN